MKKEFILYELALKMKQLGFNERCIMHWWKGRLSYYRMGDFSPTHTSAPTYSQAFRWFREKYNLHALIMPKTTPSNTTVYYIYKGKFEENWDNCFEAYEEAELACLREMIKLVKK